MQEQVELIDRTSQGFVFVEFVKAGYSLIRLKYYIVE